MIGTIDDKIDEAIVKMADMTKACQDHEKAIKFSQSALNLAHVKSVLLGVKQQANKPKGAGS